MAGPDPVTTFQIKCNAQIEADKPKPTEDQVNAAIDQAAFRSLLESQLAAAGINDLVLTEAPILFID